MNKIKKAFWETIEILNKNDVLEYVVLGIENLLENIKTSGSEYKKLKNLYEELPKKQKNIVGKFLTIHLLEL
jgi:hypothetical protein